MRICGPVIVPAIVASRSAPKYMIEHGLQICSDVSKVSPNPNEDADHAAIDEFVRELGYVLTFVRGLLTLPPLLNRDFHFGFGKSAFDFATKVISIIESPTIPQSYGPVFKPAVDTFVQYATILYTTLPEQMTIAKARLHPTICAGMDKMAEPSPPAEFAFSTMRHARSIQFCFASGCPESAQSSGQMYMRCSGCRTVAYSSKECQARAWRDKHLPHKDICKKMKQVYDVGGQYLHREADKEKFVREMKRAKIKDVTLKEIGIWLCNAYTKLQRKGPYLTPAVRQYLSQKEGPRFPEGVREHMDKVQSSFLSIPKQRNARR